MEEYEILSNNWWNNRLIVAVRSNHPDEVRRSLEAGDNVHFENDLAIREAARIGNIEIVKILLEFGSTLSLPNSVFAPITYAAAYGQLEMVKFLVGAGSRIPRFSVVSAAQNNHLDVAVFLLESDPEAEKFLLEDDSILDHIDMALGIEIPRYKGGIVNAFKVISIHEE